MNEEKRILDALGRGLLREFPNPKRKGCPGKDILTGIARHAIPLAEAEPYLEHLTTCSPCYRDFCRMRESDKVRRVRTLIAIAASVLLILSASSWVLVRRQKRIEVAQTAVLDLRNWAVVRGLEPNPNTRPLEATHLAARVTILLPLGSPAGAYETRVVTASGEPVLSASGEAKFENGVTSLQVSLRLRSLGTGSYILQIRKSGSGWNSYPLVLR